MRMIETIILFPFLLNIFSLSAFSSADTIALSQCLPEATTDAEIAAEHTSGDITYLYVGGYFPRENGSEYSTTLISIKNNQCEILISNDDFDTRFFDVVDYDTEKALWTENYKTSITQAGGVEQLQALIDEISRSDITTERSTAEVEALEELGIVVPKFYNSISSDSLITELVAIFLNSQEVPTPKSVNNVRYADGFAISNWYTKGGSSGLIIAAKEDDTWQVIGHTDIKNGEPTADSLGTEFNIPSDIANELLEAD